MRSLREQLPRESFVYLGDVARLPYGTKSQSVVREYARQCIEFLLAESVKAVVLACNTASSLALPALQGEFPVPLFGVVEPGVRAGLEVAKKGVLVLGTDSTVRSEAYLKTFLRIAPQMPVTQLACPLLVPLAEEGWWDHPLTEQVIAEYLKPLDLTGIDTVVLGCTHFPLLEPSFRRVLPEHVAIVHGGQQLAQEVGAWLEDRALSTPQAGSQVRIFSTDRLNDRLPLVAAWHEALADARVVHLGQLPA